VSAFNAGDQAKLDALFVSARTPGCYAYQLDTLRSSGLIIFELRASAERGFPQVAQSTVEMLTIQNPQSAVFSCSKDLAPPLETP